MNDIAARAKTLIAESRRLWAIWYDQDEESYGEYGADDGESLSHYDGESRESGGVFSAVR